MNLLIYHLASGQAFFSGVALIGLVVVFEARLSRNGGAGVRTILACLGLILIAASGTPLSGWFYLVAGLLTIAWIGWGGASASPRIRAGLSFAMLFSWGFGMRLEFEYHRDPHIPFLGRPVVHVVGDSISAGAGGEGQWTWPQILAREHEIEVRDLAVAGANVASARAQAVRVIDPEALVIVEIGGNDLLGATTPAGFERGLDRLLTRLESPRRTILMLELPLPPLYNRYGSIQRRQARRHGVRLVPKRFLLGVLTTPGATVDTVHLSRAGHARLAERIWRLIRPAFGPSPHPTPYEPETMTDDDETTLDRDRSAGPGPADDGPGPEQGPGEGGLGK